MSSVMIPLPHMVDLALGSPEVGAVNFNVLHSLLHVIIRQMNLSSTQVEFRGPDSDRIEAILQTSPPFPTVRMSEYVIPVDESEALQIAISRDRSRSSTKPKLKEKMPATVEETEKDEKGSKELETDKEREESKEEKDNKGAETEIEDKTGETDKDRKEGKKDRKVVTEEKKHARKSSDATPDMEEVQTVVLVEPFESDDSDEDVKPPPKHDRLSIPARKVPGTKGRGSIEKIEKTVSQLQSQLSKLNQLPSNEDLFNRSRSISMSTPVNDMWSILNLTKRMDAAESGIDKMTSMVEDLAKDTDYNKSIYEDVKSDIADYKEIRDKVLGMESKLSDMYCTLGASESRKGEVGTERSSLTKLPTKTSSPLGMVSYEGMTGDEVMSALKNEINGIKTDLHAMNKQVLQFSRVAEKIPLDLLHGSKVDKQRGKVSVSVAPVPLVVKPAEEIGGEESELQDSNRMTHFEESLKNFKNQLSGIDSSFSNQMDSFQDQISNMETELGMLLEKMNVGMPTGDTPDTSSLKDLFNMIQVLQTEVEKVANSSSKANEGQDEKELHINALLEQIEALKTMKADREDLEDALADKADQNAVNRKVSHDQFDAALEDISKGLEEAVGKLTQQETLWQQAMDDIQREIENKLDKIEISPLKDFVNAKLKILQGRLKALAAMRRESEAAGTKMKLLRNVNCISCDKNVVMRTEVGTPAIPASDPLPPSRSLRPFLTYELDMLRRQHKRLPFVRNMIHYEAALKEDEYRKAKARGPEVQHPHGKGLDHLCNRYCGGSHTVTTPQQRVTRVGHFLHQWGPEVVQLMEGTMKGTDGQVYKARGRIDSKSQIASKASPAIGSLKVGSPKLGLSPKPSLIKKESSKGSPKGTPKEVSKLSLRSPKGSPKTSLIMTPTVGAQNDEEEDEEYLAEESSEESLGEAGEYFPKGSPKGSPKDSPKGSRKGSPKGSPKGSSKGSSKHSSQSSKTEEELGDETTEAAAAPETASASEAEEVPQTEEKAPPGIQEEVPKVDEEPKEPPVPGA